MTVKPNRKRPTQLRGLNVDRAAPKKQSSPAMSTLAAQVLNSTRGDAALTPEAVGKLICDARSLAASVLSQDETRGQANYAGRPIEKRLEDIDDMLAIQTSAGNFDADPYMHGMANGMILVAATLKDEEPAFLEWPKDKELPMSSTDKPNLGLATNAELEAEITARKSLGHIDPNYRTVDASEEVKHQMNFPGDRLGQAQAAATPTAHIHSKVE